MSKIEAGKFELSETDFPLDSLLGQVETVVQHKIEEKGQSFRIKVEDGVPPAIVADRQRLAQVIANLLSNANKFTPEGGSIRLRIARLPNADKDSCLLQIEVADNGIGISKEQQARLFQSFEQADGSISRKYGGTGLGLAISKKIIELMGGKAWVESELGEGARFIFTIRAGIGAAAPVKESGPASPTPTDAPACPEVCEGPIFAGKRVLLAEDVEINREIVLALLESTGVAIDCAENGRIACEMFAAAPDNYNLIFMDIHMPEMDGYEAAKAIRAMDMPKASSIPIIALTANVFREDIEKCRAVGMNDHLGKPFNADALYARILKWLEKG